MDAEDAVQETFIRAWMYCEGLKKGDAFAPWLTRILINECNNIQRKRRRNRELYIGDNLFRLSSNIQEDRIHFIIDLCQALHHLESRYRIPIQMIFLYGFTTEETAFRLNRTRSAVSGMVRRGKEKLRAAM
jgi:RNA polymerase sigma-70 factor (ECF subfamily)